MRGIPGKALQNAHNHGFVARVLNRARRSRPRLIAQPVHAALHKKPAPFAHSGRHFCVLAAFCAVLRRVVIAEPQVIADKRAQ
jgi:hypothetical protein